MDTLFLTGFPGFLGTELLPRLLADRPEERALCLVQPKFMELARHRAEALSQEHPAVAGRIDLVGGDITRPGLALERPIDLPAVRQIFHLAALYDLGTPRGPAVAVNLDGTRHVLDLAADCPHLERFQYVSTCYVSGRHDGLFRESDLDVHQEFNNFYEETKFLAEVEVRERMNSGLPVTVYRPSIVTGDSRTGATQKYDGPYYVLRWLLRQPAALAVLPMVGEPSETVVNVIPRDFFVRAMAHLARSPVSAGKVYQVADSEPLTVARMTEVLAAATGRRLVTVPLPRGLAKWSLRRVPGVERLMGIPPEAIDYFDHPTRYATGEMERDLAGTGIEPPPFASYAPQLAAFVRAHPEIESKAMA